MHDGGTSYRLTTHERTRDDALSAETCLPYSIDWIAAALGETELTEAMGADVKEARTAFETLVPDPEDRKMLLSLYAIAYFLGKAEDMKQVLVIVGPHDCGKTTLALLLAWIGGKVNQMPHELIAKGATPGARSAARVTAGAHPLGYMENFNAGEFDPTALTLQATGFALTIPNRWTGYPQKIHPPFLTVTVNPAHVPKTKPHGDDASKFLLFDATKGHMQQFVSAGAAGGSGSNVTMDLTVGSKVKAGDFAGPMAYLALHALSNGASTFSIERDFSAYITPDIKKESAAWQVGDPEAVMEAPILDACREVIVPRPDTDEPGLGALHRRLIVCASV